MRTALLIAAATALAMPALAQSASASYVQLAEGTHTIIMEKNRLKLFEAVQAFLDEQGRS